MGAWVSAFLRSELVDLQTLAALGSFKRMDAVPSLGVEEQLLECVEAIYRNGAPGAPPPPPSPPNPPSQGAETTAHCIECGNCRLQLKTGAVRLQTRCARRSTSCTATPGAGCTRRTGTCSARRCTTTSGGGSGLSRWGAARCLLPHQAGWLAARGEELPGAAMRCRQLRGRTAVTVS